LACTAHHSGLHRKQIVLKNFFEKYRNYWRNATGLSELADTVVDDKA